MEKHFMIDIETTGIDPTKEDLLQIGVLELTYMDGLWHPGDSLEITQHTGRKPTSEFAKKHMAGLYERCNESPWHSPEEIRSMLLAFFRACGETAPNIYVMGWNASNFDLPFLFHHRCLVPSGYVQGPDGKDVMVGDTHYRVYELGGALSLASNALGYKDRNALIEDAKLMSDLAMPAGKEHDAIWDCYNQTRILNGLILLARKGALSS